MPAPTDEMTVGERVRMYRTARGMTQAALAGQVGRSEDWVSRVERGVIPVDRLSVLAEIGRVLHVHDLAELTGRAIAAVPGGEPLHESVPALRVALATLPSLLGADLPGAPLTSAELTEQVAEAWRIYEHSRVRYAPLAQRLPRLLAEAYQTRRAAGDERDHAVATRALVELYHLLQVYLRRIGEQQLARVAADRAMTLADGLGDPVLIGASAWNLAGILTNRGEVRESRELALSTISAIDPGPDATAEHVSVVGALHLAGAVASVRDGRGPDGWALLRDAEHLAGRIDGEPNLWRTSFGRTNVAMHGVHLAAEEGDAREALRLADAVEVDDGLPLERRTRYLVEVMHAHQVERDDLGTLYMIRQIRETSPEEVRMFPLVRAALRDLLRRERPLWRAEVRDHAKHVGLIAA